MKIVAISDLHGYLPKDLPDGDVLCICGDTVPLEYQRDTIASVAWFDLEFVPWTDSLPYKKVLFVAGNHDFFLQDLSRKDVTGEEHGLRSPAAVLKKLLPGNNKGKHKLVYLLDNSVEIEGKKFYGTPWIADLQNWAFYLPSEKLVEHYARIPKRCDVLLSHMPPHISGVGQVQQKTYNYLADYGSQELAEALMERDIRWSLTGHVHTGVHAPQEYRPGSFAVNVSIKDEDYSVSFKPFEFKI